MSIVFGASLFVDDLARGASSSSAMAGREFDAWTVAVGGVRVGGRAVERLSYVSAALCGALGSGYESPVQGLRQTVPFFRNRAHFGNARQVHRPQRSCGTSLFLLRLPADIRDRSAVMVRQQRNRRASVEDRWFKTIFDECRRPLRVQSTNHGKGKRWRARYVDEYATEHARGFNRKVDAQNWLNQVTTEHVTGVYVDPHRKAELFGVVAEQWFATKATKQPKTIAGYRPILDRQVLPRWGEARLGDVTYEDVQTWVTGLSRSGHRFTDRGCLPRG